MRRPLPVIAAALALACAATASAQEPKVAIGLSGWPGFAPHTLAKDAGLIR
jgi:NitT/TauT family transport system substrate-binding protein